jgi:hypothetical protein
MSNFLITPTGHCLDLRHPEFVNLSVAGLTRDIAVGLGHEHRFGNHSTLTVAQHCLVMRYWHKRTVSEAVSQRDVGLEVLRTLLHDASEAYLRDLPRPLKGLLPDYKLLEAKMQQLVWSVFAGHLTCDPTLLRPTETTHTLDCLAYNWELDSGYVTHASAYARYVVPGASPIILPPNAVCWGTDGGAEVFQQHVAEAIEQITPYDPNPAT